MIIKGLASQMVVHLENNPLYRERGDRERKIAELKEALSEKDKELRNE